MSSFDLARIGPLATVGSARGVDTTPTGQRNSCIGQAPSTMPEREMDGEIVPPLPVIGAFGELPCAVQGIDDPDAFRLQPTWIVGGFFGEHDIVGSSLLECCCQIGLRCRISGGFEIRLAAGDIACVGTDPQVEQDPTGFDREIGGQSGVVGHGPIDGRMVDHGRSIGWFEVTVPSFVARSLNDGPVLGMERSGQSVAGIIAACQP
jgi:hypothetical protein